MAVNRPRDIAPSRALIRVGVPLTSQQLRDEDMDLLLGSEKGTLYFFRNDALNPPRGAAQGIYYVANFTDYRFLQVFYPTRGILAWYSKATGMLQPLPGADEVPEAEPIEELHELEELLGGGQAIGAGAAPIVDALELGTGVEVSCRRDRDLPGNGELVVVERGLLEIV